MFSADLTPARACNPVPGPAANPMAWAAVSEPGPIHDHNEDRWRADSVQRVFVLADGMGGAGIGDLASDIAVQTVAEATRLHMLAGLPPDDALTFAAQSAHASIREAARARSACLGICTTLVAATLKSSRLHVAHVGDSRAYLLRGQQLHRLTTDHSVAQQMHDAGRATRARARRLALRGPLTRALGNTEAPPKVSLGHWQWHAGDLLMLCSDGLTDALSDAALNETLQSLLRSAGSNLGAVASGLLSAARVADGRDDITVLLASDSRPAHAAH